MTAEVVLRVAPSPAAIATLPQFTSGVWRDSEGRNLIEHLKDRYGPVVASGVLAAADLIVQQTRDGRPRKAPAPEPGGALVWHAGGVFHDRLWTLPATVCGLFVPDGAVNEPASGRPCGQCWQVTS